jgi:transcriptional regulator NrdR family protein
MRHAGCNSIETQVLNSRWRDDRVWRKRVCRKCGARIFTYEITAEEYKLFMQAKELQSQLDEPAWAVIGSLGVHATDLTHAEAADQMEKLRGTNDSGLSVVTAAVAERLKKQEVA